MNCSHYSVPDTLVGKTVTVKLYSEKLVVLFGYDKVAVHERIYSGEKGWSIKLEHYLNTLLRKPGALNTSLALKQMPQPIQALFNKHFTDKARDFVFLLLYARENNFSDKRYNRSIRFIEGTGAEKYIGRPDQSHDAYQ